MRLIVEQCDGFSKNPNDIGDTTDIQIEIELSDRTPMNEFYRRIPQKLYEEVKNYIDDLKTNK